MKLNYCATFFISLAAALGFGGAITLATSPEFTPTKSQQPSISSQSNTKQQSNEAERNLSRIMQAQDTYWARHNYNRLATSLSQLGLSSLNRSTRYTYRTFVQRTLSNLGENDIYFIQAISKNSVQHSYSAAMSIHSSGAGYFFISTVCRSRTPSKTVPSMPYLAVNADIPWSSCGDDAIKFCQSGVAIQDGLRECYRNRSSQAE